MAASSRERNWAALTWDNLEARAGRRSVERGRTYQRGDRAEHLRVSYGQEILAAALGMEHQDFHDSRTIVQVRSKWR